MIAYKTALQIADSQGWVEIRPGVYLHWQASIKADASEWGEEDLAKTTDFSSAPYWITTNNGAGPSAVHDDLDYQQIVRCSQVSFSR